MDASIFAFLSGLSTYNWVDIVVVVGAVIFAVYGIMHGITGGISKLVAYLTTFGIGLWVYNLIRASWLVENTYPNKIGAFVIAGIAGLIVGVCVGLLVAKCLRLIVSQPYDSIIGIFASLVCYIIILLGVLFLLKLTPMNTEALREKTMTGMMGYAILDGIMEESDNAGSTSK